MATSVYDAPLPIDTSITPMTIPASLLQQGQVARQQRSDLAASNVAALSDEIMALPARPVEEDQNIIRSLHSEFENKASNYLGSLEGDYGSFDIKKIKDISSEVLSPNREKIKALLYNQQVYDERLKMENALKGTGRLLNFNDDVLNAPSISSDGSINFHDVGVEERLPWYESMNRVFATIGKNSLVKQAWENAGKPGDYVDFVKGWYTENHTREAITDPITGERVSMDLIGSQLFDSAIQTYIESDQAGNQQYRWYVKNFKEQLAEQDPTMDAAELQAEAERLAFKRVKSNLSAVADKFRDKQTVSKEMMQRRYLGGYGRKGTGRGSDDDEAKPPELIKSFGVEENVTLAGTSINSLTELDAALNQYNEKYDPSNYMYEGESFGNIRSIDVATNRLLEVGPLRPEAYYESDEYRNSQFYGKSTNTRGFLQKLDAADYTGEANRAVARMPGRNSPSYSQAEWDRYRNYIKNKYGQGSHQYESLKEITDDQGNLTLDNYYVSPFEVSYDATGSAQLNVSEFFTQGDKALYGDTVTGAQEFLEDHGEAITGYLAHYEDIYNSRRNAYEIKKEAFRVSGLSETDFKLLTDKVPYEEQKTTVQEADDAYYSALFRQSTTSGLYDDMSVPYMNLIANFKEDDGPSPYLEAASHLIEQTIKGGQAYLDRLGFYNKDPYDFAVDYFKMNNLNPEQVMGTSGKTAAMLLAEQLNVGYDLRSMAKRYDDNPAKRAELVEFAEQQRQKRLAEVSPQMRKFIKAIEDGSREYEASSPVISIMKIKSENKEVYDSLLNLVKASINTQNNMFYPRNYNPGETLSGADEMAKTLIEAYADAAAVNDMEAFSGDDDATEIFEKINEIAEIHGIRHDKRDGFVVDMNILNVGYEVRGIKGLDAWLSDRGINIKKLRLMEQASNTLKEGDMVSGFIGQGPQQKRFFIAQHAGPNFQKGQYYMYTGGGDKQFFDNADQMSDWYLKNIATKQTQFTEVGTPLALSDKEFAEAYPGVDRRAYKQAYMEKWRNELVQMFYSPQWLEEAQYEADDIILHDTYSPGSTHLPYLVNPVDNNNVLSNEDVSISEDGKRVVEYDMVEPEEGILESKYNRPIIAARPLINVLKNLKDNIIENQESDKYLGPLTVTQSIRSIVEQMQIYNEAQRKAAEQGKAHGGYAEHPYSPHMEGLAVDIRLTNSSGQYDPTMEGMYDPVGQELLEFFGTEEGQDFLRENNLSALVHTVPGNARHIHLELNLPIGRNKVNNYLLKIDNETLVAE